MARILAIDPDTGAVTIGMDNAGTRTVPLAEIDYEYPMVGDYVDVRELTNGVLITRSARQDGQPSYSASYASNDGVYAGPTSQSSAGTRPVACVNKIAYVLLAFFLGSFGAHKFYTGRTAQGIVYAVFFWTAIPGIVGLVEAIIGLTKPSDPAGNIYV